MRRRPWRRRRLRPASPRLHRKSGPASARAPGSNYRSTRVMFDTQEIRSGPLPTDPSGVIPMPPAGGGQPVHLLDRLNAIFKHRRIAGTAFVLVVTAMMVQTYSTIPIYQTSARIQIEDE